MENNNKENYVWGILGVIALTGVFVLMFNMANMRTEKLDFVSNCIDEKMQLDHFTGSVKQGWDTYYDSCSKQFSTSYILQKYAI